MTRNLFLIGSMLAAGFAVSGCFAAPPPSAGGVTCDGEADAFTCTDDICPSTGGSLVPVPMHERCGSGRWCDPSNPAHDDAGCVGVTPPECATNCSDDIACTRDFCDSGTCEHVPQDERCPTGQLCSATTGCYTPSTTEECSSNADCNDSVACTVNSCVSGMCEYTPDNGMCPTGQHCSATAGCVNDDTMPPPGDFHCVDGLVGDAIRIHPDANGVSSIGAVDSPSGPAVAPRDLSNGPGVILWGLNYGHPLATPSDRDAAGEMHVGAPGATYEYGIDGTTGGGINTMLYVDDADLVSNWSDLRSLEGHAASEIGYWVEARQGGTWMRLPDRFVRIARDTVNTPWSNARELPSSLRGTIAVRVVVYTSGAARCSD